MKISDKTFCEIDLLRHRIAELRGLLTDLRPGVYMTFHYASECVSEKYISFFTDDFSRAIQGMLAEYEVRLDALYASARDELNKTETTS